MSEREAERTPPEPNRDEETGRWTTDKRGRIFDAMVAGEPHSAAELASITDINRETVAYHLNRLADDGKIRKKKFNPTRVTWIKHPDGGEEGESA